MEMKKLKTALFGYKKKDVIKYVEELVSDYEKNTSELQEEIVAIKKQNQTLVSENAESFKKLSEMQSERDYISKAVINAEHTAREMIANAEQEMATLKANKAAEIALANEELEKLKEQIESLKKSAVATLRKYEAQMDDLVSDVK